MTRIIGYCRVSTEDQGRSMLGIEGQQAAIQGYVQSRIMHGWELTRWALEPGVSGYKLPMSKRPGMCLAMRDVREGRADGIVVAYLDRISRRKREIEDFFLAADDPKTGFVLVCLDIPGLDTSTAVGRLFLSVQAAVAQFQAERTGENTRAALAAKRERGESLGAPRRIEPDVEAYIRALREAGTDGGRLSYRSIARRLDREGITTVTGGTWAASTVATVVNRAPA